MVAFKWLVTQKRVVVETHSEIWDPGTLTDIAGTAVQMLGLFSALVSNDSLLENGWP